MSILSLKIDTMLKPKFKFILFKGKRLSNGKFSIKLQVKAAPRDYRRIDLNLTAFPDQWDAARERFKDNDTFEAENEELRALERRANNLLKDFRMEEGVYDFCYETFKERFLGEGDRKKQKESQIEIEKPDTVLGFLEWYIGYLTEKERLATGLVLNRSGAF